MNPIVVAVFALTCLAGTACTNHYKNNFQASNSAVLSALKGSKPLIVDVVVLPKSAHKMAAEERAKSNELLGESRFQTSGSIAESDLTTFAREIGSDLALSTIEFVESRQQLVTHQRLLRSVTRGTVDGKPVSWVTETWVPYPEMETVTIYEYWATFFRKGTAPKILP